MKQSETKWNKAKQSDKKIYKVKQNETKMKQKWNKKSSGGLYCIRFVLLI
jgi:hypothetical protein